MPRTDAEMHGCLRLAEELNQKIIEVVPGGIVHVLIDGSIVRANEEALRILGLSYDELTERYVESFETETLNEDGSPCPQSDYPVVQALMTGERAGPRTVGVRQPDGGIHWAVFTAIPVTDTATGNTTGAVVTFLNITERLAAEKKLRESEARLRSVFESVASMVLVVDLDGIIRDINRPRPEYQRSDVLGRHLCDFVHPDDEHTVRTCFERVIATGEPDGYELWGRPEWPHDYAVRMVPTRIGDETVGVTVSAWDTTEHRALQARLMISDRMATVGTLAAGVAHEINNPLTYMMGNLDELARDLGRGRVDPDIQRRQIANVLEGTERIRRVVGELSTFSGRRDEGLVPTDVHAVLDLALRMAHNEIRFRAQVVRDFGEVPLVVANDSRLGQALLNLLINAAQAIGEGNLSSNEIRVKTCTDGAGRCRIEITDTGEGIDPAILAHVFEPFVTTKDVGQGTGLGLYICHNIVSALGGQLLVDSKVGGGTTFTVVLDAAPARVDVSPPDAVDVPAAAPCRVLLVDDEPEILNLLSASLLPHHVWSAASGREAIRALESEEFDVVICDLIMPELTGMELYEYIGSRHPGKEERMVFMTGGAFTEAARDFLERVRNPRIQKPFPVAEVRRIIERMAQSSSLSSS